METIYWLIGTQIILLIVAIAKIYGQSYFSEKGKNLAQKEDISEITEKIEGIRALYSKENDELKQQLTYLFGVKSSHRTEERNAIIHFNEVYYHWLYTTFEIPIDAYNDASISKLVEKRTELAASFVEVNKATSKMSLLVKNKELLEVANLLILELIKYNSWTTHKLLLLQFNLENETILRQKFIQLFSEYDKNKLELQNLANEERKLRDDKKEFVNTFITSKVAEFKKCIMLCKRFEELAKNYLTSIE